MKIGIGLLLLAIVFNAIFLFSEVKVFTPFLNDEVLHLTIIREASLAIQNGLDPTDFWLTQIALGYPLFHYYQHLPHLILVIFNQLTGLPLTHLLDLSRYILLVLFPVSIFLAMLRFGFNSLAAGLSALISSLLSTNGLYGLDYGSYLWRGFGLYTQLWAMFFLPLALAETYRFILKKNSLFWPVFLSVIVLLSNLMYGYILVLSSIIFVFLKPKKEEIISRFKRLVIILFFNFLITSYFFIPIFLDKEYLNRSIWEEPVKYDSFGHIRVVGDLLVGNLLDYGRFPSLTIFFFSGIIIILILGLFFKEEKYRFLISLTIIWLILYFGRKTFGNLFNILPFSQYLHLHRFIGGFHFGAILIIGTGLAQLWQLIQKHFSKFTFLALIIFLTFLLPIYIERARYFKKNADWKTENQIIFSQSKSELSEIKETLKSLAPGRVYAGLSATFGNYPYYRIGFVPFYALFPQWGIDSFGYSYHALPLSDDVRLHFDDTKPIQYNLFNVRYVLLHKTWTAPFYYSKVKEFENYILYETPTTGYFDLVDTPAVFYGNSKDFYYPNSKWLFSSLPELKQHPILEISKEPKKTFGLPVFSFQEVDEKILSDLAQVQPEAGKILKEKVEINKYWVQFEANRDCYLMLKSNFHPGWKVYLDYEKVSPVMLAPGFIGIKVEPGIHQALFLYKSPVWRLPLLVLGIFILGGLSIISKKNYFMLKLYQVD
ncbi:MAG: hypothetical protein QME61_02880 [Patescibacteria group bacterium]|nr:hypothetical protein [Patescibacteria group bacterium]